MSLYDKINNVLNVEDFLNDTMLYIGSRQTWEQAFDSYPLSDDEELEHVSSITYWQDRYDLALTETDRAVVRLQMRDNLIEAYRGCDRQKIDEATFKELIGEATTKLGISRVLPFSVDEERP